MTGRSVATTYRTLDAWRGVASLAVVISHASHTALGYSGLSGIGLLGFALYGHLGVEVFFVISGYCIINAAMTTIERQRTLGSYVKARLRRIFPPYWASLLIASGLSAITSWLVATGKLRSSTLAVNGGPHKDAFFYLSSFTLTQTVFHQPFLLIVWWTLCYEVAFYIIIGIFLFAGLRGIRSRTVLNAIHLFTALTLVALWLFPVRSFYPFDLWPQFGIGIVVYDTIRNWNNRRALGAAVLVFLLYGSLLLQHQLHTGRDKTQTQLDFMVAFAFALLLLVVHRYDERLMRFRVVQWFSWLGLFSYSLYLIHVPILGLFSQCAKLLRMSSAGFLIWQGIAVMGSVAVARGYYQWFERPFTGMAQRAPKLDEEAVAGGVRNDRSPNGEKTSVD